MKGSLRMTGTMVPLGDSMTEHGIFVYYYENGQVESEGYYEHGIKVGAWKRYTVKGSERPDRYYKPESANFIRHVMAGK
jgi:antitoxin component YwqK of YwqJK toxin-antitoxin module